MLGMPDLSVLCAPLCLWYLLVLANIFPFDYIQNKVTPARVLGSSACAWVRPRSWVRPRLLSSVSQAIASARVAPPVSVTDLGRHGLAPPRLYCRSVCSDLVLWIRAFVFSRRHDLIIFVRDLAWSVRMLSSDLLAWCALRMWSLDTCRLCSAHVVVDTCGLQC